MDRDLSPDLPIVIGVSTRALFDLEEEHAVFKNEGVAAYTKLQRGREGDLLKEGTAFEVIRRLLALNDQSRRLIDVVVLSQNSPDLSLRAFNSFEHYGLPIRRGSFTSGRSVAPFVKAWSIDLFLSNDDKDVREALAGGAAAAKLGPPPCVQCDPHTDEVRIVFDGNSVLFSDESDLIYKEQGLDKFLVHERDHAKVPMNPGPFGNFLQKLAEVREIFMKPDGVSKIRIGLVTARNARPMPASSIPCGIGERLWTRSTWSAPRRRPASCKRSARTSSSTTRRARRRRRGGRPRRARAGSA